jgi:RNA polymerase sigma factor (sigma-70 family)
MMPCAGIFHTSSFNFSAAAQKRGKLYLVEMFFRQKPTALSDAELILRFRESNDLALVSELFTRYTSLVYGVCVKYLKDRDDAKDAAMHIFEKLPSSLKNHDVTHFKSWLYVTSRNVCLMQIRSKKGKLTEELPDQLMESDFILHPEEDPELEDNLKKLENCIEKLALEQKECVRLFFIDEKCYKDIVTITGFDLNKVKSYIQNGKRNLKICMDQHGAD